MTKEFQLDIALRDECFCLPLLNILFGCDMGGIKYVWRPGRRPGVRVYEGAWVLLSSYYIVDIGIEQGPLRRAELVKAAVRNISDIRPEKKERIFSVIICPEGIFGESAAVVKLQKGQVILLNAMYTDPGNADPELLKWLDFLREDEQEVDAQSQLAKEFWLATLGAKPFIAAESQNLKTLAECGISVPEDVTLESLVPTLLHQPAMDAFLSALLGREVNIKRDPGTSRLLDFPLLADICAYDDEDNAYVFTVQPEDIGPSNLAFLLQEIAAKEMEDSWDVHAIAICNYDAFGAGQCLYTTELSIAGHNIALPSRIQYHILCIPSEGMVRNAPKAIQELLDHLASNTGQGELVQLLRQSLDKWELSDGIRAATRKGFRAMLEHAYKGETMHPSFYDLEIQYSAVAKAHAAPLISKLHAMILYFQGSESVESIAKAARLPPESVRRVLWGDALCLDDLNIDGQRRWGPRK